MLAIGLPDYIAIIQLNFFILGLMSRFSFSLCFLCIAFIAFAAEILTGKVVAVADGDTITILNSNFQQVKIRLHGIDCPEKSQDFGQKAKQFTSDLCYGKTVEVQALDTDRYGRTIGLVTLPDGKILNKELLKAGLAWHYTHYDKSQEFAILEATAKKNKVGLWVQPNAIAPWDFRRSK